MASPLESIIYTPDSTSDFHRMAEGARKLHHGAADLLVVTAAELSVALRHAYQGNPWVVGVDARMAAKSVTKHLVRAARMDLEAGAEVVRGWTRYWELFVEPKPAAAGRRAFNVRG